VVENGASFEIVCHFPHEPVGPCSRHNTTHIHNDAQIHTGKHKSDVRLFGSAGSSTAVETAGQRCVALSFSTCRVANHTFRPAPATPPLSLLSLPTPPPLPPHDIKHHRHRSGSFPLDHFKQCQRFADFYQKCLRKHKVRSVVLINWLASVPPACLCVSPATLVQV
jgi:hypothetical protein